MTHRRTIPRLFLLGPIALMIAACQTGPARQRHVFDDDVAPFENRERLREQTVEAHLSAMSLDERIAQRFIVFVPRGFSLEEGSDRDTFLEEIRRIRPGGLILYPWNYSTSGEVQRMTRLFQATAQEATPGRRLLLCADQEGGRVMAFRFRDIVQLPSAYRVGRHGDARFVEAAAYLNAVELRDLGLNMNLAPVLDVTDVADRGIIGDRSMGNDPAAVAELGVAYVSAFRAAGVIATAKHFPGHGVTTVDSHGRLPVVEYDLEALRTRDLRPFAAAVGAGVPVIMTAHILFPEIDPSFPVTLSEVFLRDVLRDELGFDGVVISDGLEMGALAANYDLDTTLERAIRYSVDIILLYARYDLEEIVRQTRDLVRAGRISEEEIDTGVRRILALKFDYGLLDEVP